FDDFGILTSQKGPVTDFNPFSRLRSASFRANPALDDVSLFHRILAESSFAKSRDIRQEVSPMVADRITSRAAPGGLVSRIRRNWGKPLPALFINRISNDPRSLRVQLCISLSNFCINLPSLSIVTVSSSSAFFPR